MLQLDLQGLKFEFRIENYRPSTKENWDYEWCKVYARLYTAGPCVNYEVYSECLLCSEVEWLYEKLGELMDGIMTEDTAVPNIEPDFEFMLYPGGDSYHMGWRFNLWEGGALTCNSIHTMLDEDDIKELYKYLETVLAGGKSHRG